MENKVEKKKNKKIFPILAVLGLLVVLGGGIGAALLIGSNSSKSVDVQSQMNIEDEETLRQVLLSKGTSDITITKDIIVSKELVVNGTKTLRGKMISMNLRHTGTGESVLSVENGGTLNVSGATIDGNGVVKCISVKNGGNLNFFDGNAIFGYPYGMEIGGYAEISGGTIDRSADTGVYVGILGQVYMTGGTVSNDTYSVVIAEDGYVEIGEKVKLERATGIHIYNYGEAKITGCKLEGTSDNAITNEGTMTVQGTKNKKMEICNAGRSAIVVKNKAKLTAKNLYMHDLGLHAIDVEKSSKADVQDCEIRHTGKSSIYTASSNTTVKNVNIYDGETIGVATAAKGKIEMENVIIDKTGQHGIQNNKGYIAARNVEIKNAGSSAIFSTGEETETALNHVKIYSPKERGLRVSSGRMTAKNVEIYNSGKEGAAVGKKAKLVMDNGLVKNAGTQGLANYGGIMDVTANKSFNPDNTKGVGVIILSPGKRGIHNEDGTITVKSSKILNTGSQGIYLAKNAKATINDCVVDGTVLAGVYVANSDINLKNSTIKNIKTVGIYGAKDKDKLAATHKVILNNVTVEKTGNYGIQNYQSHIVMTDIRISDTGNSGIFTNGESPETNMNQVVVTDTKERGLRLANGKVTARNLTVSKSEKEGIAVGGKANVRLDNVTINKAGTQGLANYGGEIHVTVDTKYNPENTEGNGITITSPGKRGMHIEGGVMSVRASQIKDVPQQGVYISKKADVIFNICSIYKTGQAGFYVENSDVTLKNADIAKSGSIGVYATNSKENADKKVVLNKVTIKDTETHGIQNYQGNLDMTDVDVSKAGGSGFFCNGTTPVTKISKLNVKDTEARGLRIGEGTVTGKNVTTDETKEEGIALGAKTDVNLQSVTVKNAGAQGIGNYGGKITLKTVKISDCKKDGIQLTDGAQMVSGKDIKVANPGARGLSANKTSEVTVLDGLIIQNAGQQAIYVVDDAKATLKDVTVEGSAQAAIRTMSNGEIDITGGTIETEANAIYTGASSDGADKTAKVTITDVTVNRVGSKKSALVVIAGKGNTVTMKGNSVLDGKNLVGRGVDVKGTFIMEDGTITGHNTTGGATTANVVSANTQDAGAVYVLGTFRMNGGTITGNKAGTSGGAVGIEDKNAVFEMNGGTITSNTAQYGGGVMVRNGDFTFNGGTITNNDVTQNGGGIYLKDTYTITLAGGNVSGNKTAKRGKDIYMSKGTIPMQISKAMSADATIGFPDDVYPSEAQIAASKGLDETQFAEALSHFVVESNKGKDYIIDISGTLGSHAVNVKVDGTEEVKKYVSLDQAVDYALSTGTDCEIELLGDVTIGNKVVVSKGNLKITAKKAVTVTATDAFASFSMFEVKSGASLSIKGASGAEITLKNELASPGRMISSAGTLDVAYVNTVGAKRGISITGGKATVDHVQVEAPTEQGIYVETSTDTTISNFRVVGTGAASVLIDKNSKVTLKNGEVETKKNGIYVRNGGVGTMDSVKVSRTVSNQTLVVVAANSTLTIQGNSVIDGKKDTYKGRGVEVAGTLNFAGGTIKDNDASTADTGAIVSDNKKQGAAVYVVGIFNMTGGTITGNKSANGAILLNGASAECHISGGTIQDNTSTGSGGGIIGRNWSVFDMSGGTIKSNTATNSDANGGGIYLKPGHVFTMTGGIITGNTANRGGGLCMESSGSAINTVNLYAGEISGNTAKTSGGGAEVGTHNGTNNSARTIINLKGAFKLDTTGIARIKIVNAD